MSGGAASFPVVRLATCASTMDEARKRFGAGADGARGASAGVGRASDGGSTGVSLACVVADEQTAGRGRRGHSWESRPGESLMVTYAAWLPSSLVGGPFAGWITLGAGVATMEGIRTVVGEDAPCARDLSVKWPNDVYLAGRKLAGILCEVAGAKEGRTCILVGVGVNLVMDEDRLPTPQATALSLHDPCLPPYGELRDELVEAIGGELSQVLDALTSDPKGECAYLQERMSCEGYLVNRPVRVTLGNGKVDEGVARRVSQEAALVVEVGEGSSAHKVVVTAGDVEALPQGPRASCRR